MKDHDFGPYGKGFDGYVHYMRAKSEEGKGGGGGKRPQSGKGCLTSLLFVFSFAAVAVHGVYEFFC